MLSVFIVNHIPESGAVHLDGDEGHHAAKVVRVTVGEEIIVTDGRGTKALVTVTNIHKDQVECSIRTREFEDVPQISLNVVQALTKSDRARETVELLTEAGVSSIIPWGATRSIGQWKNDEDSRSKWQNWAKESTKQSRRTWIPSIQELHATKDVVNAIGDYDCVLLCDEASETKISKLLQGSEYSKILIIIGPEGGITPEEREILSSAGAQVVGLGRPVFRSAHAGAAALAAVQTALGIW
mgnify:FL=1